MKKKMLSIFLILVMEMLLNACSSPAKTEPEEDKDVKVADETPEKEIKKELSHDFDSETNQQETFYVLSYQVPASWERKTLDDKHKIYYYPENGMLMLSFNNGTLDFSSEDGYADYINSIKNASDNFVELDHYTTTILDNRPAFNLTFTAVISDTPLTAYNIVFSTENQTYSIMYADYDVSTCDRSKDFEEIIKSINYTQKVLDLEQSSYTPPELTTGQVNASNSARDYLNVMAFSYTGLIEQLKYEGYSEEDATYAADNCGADWNEQAAQKAQEYLDTMSFSRSGLIEQLQFEGFTAEQAEYGVSAVGY